MACFIIEDEIIQGEWLKQIVLEISAEIDLAFNMIIVDKKIDMILNKKNRSLEKNLYFVDIEIKGDKRKGLEYAKEIRAEDKNSLIVFVSNHDELALESYQYFVSALSFIKKNPDRQIFKREIKRCLLLYKKELTCGEEEDYFVFKSKHTTVKILFQDILYFTTAGDHKIKLVNKERSIVFFGSLKQVETLDDRLIRVHQSFIISKEKVKSFDRINRQLTLSSYDKIPVARRFLKQVDRIFE